MDGSNTWNRKWKQSWRRDGLTSPSIESVWQAVGVRSDKRCRQITFGIDTAAGRTVVPARHLATRGYRCHWDADAGAHYSTAGKSVVWDEGRRPLVSRDPEGRLMTTESRQTEVKRPMMAVKPMTQQGQWVCFGPHRAFAYKIESGRVIPFENTSKGWNFTVELEAPDDRKLRENMDTMRAEKRVEQMEKIEHLQGLFYSLVEARATPAPTSNLTTRGPRIRR